MFKDHERPYNLLQIILKNVLTGSLKTKGA